ncbi:phospholipase B-like 1 [Ostrea edulis]|uniref:phospholipase B-like 1 n=1 Tax=Ostrea edulis TaxID=37623 RepID=UPI0024AF11B3|nr:phospholipase B-like 1 [Ostrea edulis]
MIMMLRSVEILTLFTLSLILHLSSGEYTYGTVTCKDQVCKYQPNVLNFKATACGSYNDTLLQTGWGILDIVGGQGDDTDVDILYGAGYLEGIFTAERIWQHYQNIKDFFLSSRNEKVVKNLGEWFDQQNTWMRSMIKKSKSDPLWRHIGLIMAQFDGLVAGYKAAAKPEQDLDVFAFQVLNGAGDLLDLLNVIDPSSSADWQTMTHSQILSYVQDKGMCSALIKVLGAYEDIFMSHSSWFVYQATMRIYKHYNFNVRDPATSAKRVSFSSYPGFLESLDDFYHMSSNMVMLQTTNNVFNKTLYNYVKPESLFAWQRVRVANMIANGGEEWAKIVAQYNSGTYNNQYMIIDLKKIHLKSSIEDDALWVVEQIPSLVESGDQSAILRTGYWASYNVPFFEKVYNLSGYPEVVAKEGTDFSYQLAPRAKIFRRDEGKVMDLASMKKIMRYNDYKNDLYSEGNSCNTICCRGDLREKEPKPSGCYDTKVSDYKMALNFEADIVNGPTLGSGLPPFSWTPAFKQAHIGLPTTYKFEFLRTSPKFKTP